MSPACQEPMTRSPAEVISQTVPSSSTRPNRCGSLDGPVGTTAAATGARARAGPRAGPGPRDAGSALTASDLVASDSVVVDLRGH